MPVIIPAFPILLPVRLADFTPKIIANIPVGKVIYQNSFRILDNDFTIVPKITEIEK